MIRLKKILKESKYSWDRQFGDPLPTLKDVMETHPKTPLKEAKYKETYRSMTARDKEYNRIWPIGGHPRVTVRSYNETQKTGRMKTAYIEIDGDKMWVDAYKKIAFKGNGDKGDVIDFVRKETGNSNA